MNKHKNKLLIAGIILVACVLRTPLTGVGSLISQIRPELDLSHFLSGMITTIPLIAFAAVSPFVGKLSGTFGAGKTLTLSLFVLTAGIVLRSMGGSAGFFPGTAVIGIGIAVGNVLLPSIIKSAFPDKVGLLTGIYTTCIAISAGVSSGISIPLSHSNNFGWRGSLSIWVLLTLPAIIIWLPLWNYRTNEPSAGGQVSLKVLLRSPAAWSVTVYMGVQSLLFYSFVAWLPAILQSKGISPDSSGYYASLYQWAGIPASFAVPLLAAGYKDQKLLSAIISVIYAAGLILVLVSGGHTGLLAGVLLCGFCTGACLSLAMCLIGLRTKNASQAASLSGISQSFGYALAAVSPTLLGGIYDSMESWTVPLLVLIAMTIVLLISGVQAGRNRTVC